ncbi:MAG: cytochrome c [Opitutaceae bacterium]|nr:cytochrome c [Opitutaceae bacterium]
MRHVYLVTLFVVVLTVSILGFRGTKFTSAPMDVFPEWAFPGMKHQPKPYSQGTSAFFADGRADRVPVAGTVQRGMLRENDHMNHGKSADGSFARGFPSDVTVDFKLLERGQDRYTIYCSPCHGNVGDGNGITKKYGINTMYPYADKLVPADRWAVVAYVRALQRAQTGSTADVPGAHKSELGLK